MLETTIRRSIFGFFALPLLFVACSSAKTNAPAPTSACDARTMIAGVCPGAPTASICSGDACVDGVVCASVVRVTSSSELSAAAKSAKSGACIALAAGSYDAVDLGNGVSLLGHGAAEVSVAGVRIAGGAVDATMRGVTIGAGGIAAAGAPGNAGKLTVDRVVVRGAKASSLRLDDVDASIVASSIVDAAGAGILANCATTGCTAKLSIRSVSVQSVKTYGVWIRGVTADVQGLSIANVQTDGAFGSGTARGLEIAAGATVNATGVSVTNCADVGLLVVESTATITSFGVLQTHRGLQLQQLKSGTFSNFELRDNAGVALGTYNVDGIIIQQGLIASTGLEHFPSPIDSAPSFDSGDGVNWTGATNAKLSGVTIQGSARQAAILEAGTSGEFDASFTAGDEKTGIIIQQGAVAGTSGPTVHSNVTPTHRTGTDALPLLPPLQSATPSPK